MMEVLWTVLKIYMWLLSIHPLVFLVAAIAAGWLGGWKWAIAVAVFAAAIFGPIVFLPTLLPFFLRSINWGIAKLDSLRPSDTAA